jgi:hypothetical protein
LKTRFTIRQASASPESFVLIIPAHGAQPELCLGPFNLAITEEEMRKMGLQDLSIRSLLDKARSEFEAKNCDPAS